MRLRLLPLTDPRRLQQYCPVPPPASLLPACQQPPCRPAPALPFSLQALSDFELDLLQSLDWEVAGVLRRHGLLM